VSGKHSPLGAEVPWGLSPAHAQKFYWEKIMQLIWNILFIFIVGSTFGYILEVFYRTYKCKRLINPGFLSGCCLPIYGTGGIVLYLLCSLDLSFIENDAVRIIILMVVATILMTVIEHISGLISIKCFNSKLWDYSNRWGNVQGIICPLFSLVWGSCCLIFYFFVFPWIGDVAETVTTNLFGMFFMGLYYGIFIVDLCYSINLMAKIKSYATKIKELVNFENFKKAVSEKYKNKKGKRFSNFSPKFYQKIMVFIEEHKKQKDENSNNYENKNEENNINENNITKE